MNILIEKFILFIKGSHFYLQTFLLKSLVNYIYLLKLLSSRFSLSLRFITLKQFKMLSGVVQLFLPERRDR